MHVQPVKKTSVNPWRHTPFPAPPILCSVRCSRSLPTVSRYVVCEAGSSRFHVAVDSDVAVVFTTCLCRMPDVTEKTDAQLQLQRQN